MLGTGGQGPGQPANGVGVYCGRFFERLGKTTPADTFGFRTVPYVCVCVCLSLGGGAEGLVMGRERTTETPDVPTEAAAFESRCYCRS